MPRAQLSSRPEPSRPRREGQRSAYLPPETGGPPAPCRAREQPRLAWQLRGGRVCARGAPAAAHGRTRREPSHVAGRRRRPAAEHRAPLRLQLAADPWGRRVPGRRRGHEAAAGGGGRRVADGRVVVGLRVRGDARVAAHSGVAVPDGRRASRNRILLPVAGRPTLLCNRLGVRPLHRSDSASRRADDMEIIEWCTYTQAARQQVIEGYAIFLPPVNLVVARDHFVEGKALARFESPINLRIWLRSEIHLSLLK